MIISVRLYFLIVVLLILQGCVAFQAFPVVARQGDTITLAIGSQDDLTKERIVLEFVSDNTSSIKYQIPIDISSNIRNIIRIYPDKTSRAWVNYNPTTTMNSFIGHGAWQNILVVDLPGDIPVGDGHFKVSFSPNVILQNVAAVQNVEDISIGINIIADSTPEDNYNNFYYAQNPGTKITGKLNLLEPLSQLVLRYGDGSNSFNYIRGEDVSAVEYKLTVPVVGNAAITADELQIIYDDRPGFNANQAQIGWFISNNIVTVNIVYPTNQAFKETAIRFSIIVDDSINGNKLDVTGSPSLISYRYFNISGDEIAPQYTPELVIQRN